MIEVIFHVLDHLEFIRRCVGEALLPSLLLSKWPSGVRSRLEMLRTVGSNFRSQNFSLLVARDFPHWGGGNSEPCMLLIALWRLLPSSCQSPLNILLRIQSWSSRVTFTGSHCVLDPALILSPLIYWLCLQRLAICCFQRDQMTKLFIIESRSLLTLRVLQKIVCKDTR